jgi:hypothetical protein
MDLMGAMAGLTGLMGGNGGGKISAESVQGVAGMVQGHLAENNGQAGNTDMLSNMISQKLGLDAGMVNMVLPQLIQAVQSGSVQGLLDKNQDGHVDLADLMGLVAGNK